MKIPKLCDGVSDDIEKCNEEICEPCIRGKLIRKPFNTERARAKRPLEIVHTDICGKISPATPNGEEYIMTCLDDCTHFLKLYLLRTRNEAEEYIKEYINEAEAYFNLKTSKLRLDNGGEYSSNDFKLWCRSRGIQLAPQLNGKAESPTTTIDTTPAEKWYGKKPNLSNLRGFGQVVYTKNLGYLADYAPNGYRVWNPETRKVYAPRDIKFTNKFEENDEYQGGSIGIESLQQFEEEYEDENRNEDNNDEDGKKMIPIKAHTTRRQRHRPKKVKDDGRYKARLVARGCQQKEGTLDYGDIFSSVVQSTSLRILLAIAASENLEMMIFDVKSAFLYGQLNEEIYMRLPQGYNHPGKICLKSPWTAVCVHGSKGNAIHVGLDPKPPKIEEGIPALTRKSIYIDVKYHFIRDEMKNGWFIAQYCPTQENQADILTKPMQPQQFEKLKQKLMF
ncbi:hypothetical protein ONE63_007129 [Megalurothrips usitatus]|uniref:Integrase catalytic domain-containing protein n=1 Tax=Megalurothrips usitatus TaxID=439358 RepID=A0AAV7XV54_9NEOP|nr:hypothetical protein ONE63_007129 [Megalurothrips usitatus]